ncbi:MAG TPA: sulfite exporter TauE/SafE family protein [Stackebrandtia sp.]|uniref:sulfite exporter TauE/SafE family protein n=1 Tax=Stackebrandtia sp. TaxID=2023065 RepID=UPI002D24C358|nr:sulfite exporter TauE/SafE family protein [Stackebrandtia sp.]HZE41467.1 sulfite exporter TauE/SafE family protein [Stackebrandtia sp.]
MVTFVLFGIVGLVAQLIGGALGMGHGVISTSLLLTVGVAPAAASASVHLAEMGTMLTSSVAHWRYGNVDWRVVLRVAIPGAVGAFAGATVLSSLPAQQAAPWISAILIVIGTWLVVRFVNHRHDNPPPRPPLRTRFLAPLGLIAGTVDATGGGGWGPIATSAMLVSGRLEPRKVVGSASVAKFMVSTGASAGFLFGMTDSGVVWPVVLALLLGGLIAAPFAAWLVRRLPTWVLGVAVGGLIILINARTVLDALGAPIAIYVATFAVLLAAWSVALTVAIRVRRAEPARV